MSHSHTLLSVTYMHSRVAFLEFPSNATFIVRESSTLTCVVKAAKGATVRWLFDGQPLPLVVDSAACSDSNSSNTTHAVVSETQLPGNFTIFRAEVVVRYASVLTKLQCGNVVL